MTKTKKQVPSPEAFLQSASAWMLNNNLILGDVPEDIDLQGSLKLTKVAASIFTALGSLTPLIATGGAKAEKVKRALEPYNRLTDLAGLHIPQGMDASGQYMILIIRADALSPKEIHERFDLFVEFASGVAALGWRINFQAGEMKLYPVLVYFDSGRFAVDAPKVLEKGWQLKFWKKISLRACAVDIPKAKIEYAEIRGVSGVAERGWDKVGVKSAFRKFHDEDLQLILQLANKLGQTQRE